MPHKTFFLFSQKVLRMLIVFMIRITYFVELINHHNPPLVCLSHQTRITVIQNLTRTLYVSGACGKLFLFSKEMESHS